MTQKIIQKKIAIRKPGEEKQQDSLTRGWESGVQKEGLLCVCRKAREGEELGRAVLEEHREFAAINKTPRALS